MIKRELYKGYFTQDGMSKWQCPTCNSGSLQVIQDKFIMQYNSATEMHYHEDWFDAPEMIVYTFTTLLSCTNPSCKEVISCSGTGGVEREQYSYDDSKYVEYFKPFFFYPSLKIFQIPEKTPEEIKKAIETSFSLVFNNKSAAANQIRIALECLLNSLGVEQDNKKGYRLNLHDRIELLIEKYSKIKDICFAIKWLGNSGSHCEEEMTMDNVLDGYEMMSFILDELYDNKHERIATLAKQINDKKGV